jgi:protein associated with RNAse G/E
MGIDVPTYIYTDGLIHTLDLSEFTCHKKKYHKSIATIRRKGSLYLHKETLSPDC